MKSSRKQKLVCGVGINDAEYPVYISATIGGRRNVLWICPIYQAWTGILERCYSISFQSINKTYIGCTICLEWLSFSAFREWMTSQPWEGNQLDKDILLPGNKIYSPEACVFVPASLNLFLCDSGAARGEWPIGVDRNKASGKLRARCRNPFNGKNEHLGYFTEPAEAHEAWRQRKHQHACTYADMQSDPRISDALRARYAAGATA